MKLLILGGTRFLGRHSAEQALERGHELTLMHRGRSAGHLFPQAQHLIADRNGDLALLRQGEWDAVIDTSAYLPRQVLRVGEALVGRVGHYQLVSSISVYADTGQAGTSEDAALKTLADPDVEAVSGETYGGLKALCERAAQAAFGSACLINRPGLLVGPHDPTGRFDWWVQRVQRGGTMLAPGDPRAPVQLIDARDAAAWMLLQSEHGTAGVFNLTGPNQPLDFGRLLQTVIDTLQPSARLQWVDEAFLLAQGVAPWSDLPLWLPRAQSGMLAVNLDRARATGLLCRPLTQTLRDTAGGLAAAGESAPSSADGPPRPAVGLTVQREAALLAGWQARSSRRTSG